MVNYRQDMEKYASPKGDGTRCPEELSSPVSMLHPSQMFYENLS